MSTPVPEVDLAVRNTIYGFFADNGRAPSLQEIAKILKMDAAETRISLHKLHRKHMIFLQPETDRIRMANPFSAVPTDYRVQSENQTWWANCAWDALGIPAALGVDVVIHATYPDSRTAVQLAVQHGTVNGHGHVVYFALPCREWYDDLIFT